MKRTFKKVLSTVVASLFVLQSASLATVGIGATDTNEVLKYTPTIDAVKDDAYATSYKKVVGDVTYSYLYDDSYIYLYAEGKMTVDATSYLNITLTGTPVNAGVITSEGINFIIQPFHNPTAGVVGNVQTWQGIGNGQAKMGYNLSSGASASTEFAISVDGGNFIAEVRVANATALNKVVAFANGIYNAGTHVAGEGDYWGFWGDGSAPKYTALTLGKAYDPSHQHTWSDEYTIDVEPTCTTAGSKSIHCLTCDAINPDTVTAVDALGHNWSDEYTEVPATCSVPGVRYRACLRTGCDERTDVTVLTTPHDFVDGVCSVCNAVAVLNNTPEIDGVVDEAYMHSASVKLDTSRLAGMGSCATLDATAYYLWNGEYLYVAAVVTGDPNIAKTGNSPWTDNVVFSLYKTGFNSGEAARVWIEPLEDKVTVTSRDGFGSNITSTQVTGNTEVAYTASTESGKYIVEARIKIGSNLVGTCIKTQLGVEDGQNYAIYGNWEFDKGAIDSVLALSGDIYVPSHEHVFSDEWTIDVPATCTKMGVKSHHCTVDGCDVVSDQTDVPKLPHTAGELTTTEPTCVEEGKTTSVCTVCGNTFTVGEPTPALGHTTTSGKCERCGEYVNARSNVPYATAVIDGTKDAAYDSGAKYYVNGATAYVVYDKDYFYAYVEAADAENVAYLTIGSPDKTDNIGGFWTNTASVKFDFTAKNIWTKAWVCGIYNQNGTSTFADNISVDGGDTCIAQAGVDYVYSEDAKAVEIKIHIGEGYAPNNYAGKAFVGSTMYYLGLGTEANGVNLNNNGGSLNNAIINQVGIVNLTLDKCLDGCTVERVTTVEPTCTEAGTSVEKCTVCGAIKDGTVETIPALGHDWEYTVDTEPTCTEDGIAIARACKRTGCDVYEEGSFVLPALGHNYNELGICANCGDNKNLVVATYSVTLMDVLNINAKINKANVEAYDDFYVKFVEHYKDGSPDNVKIVTERSYESSRDRYVFAYGSTPQCAVDDVDVYVYGVKDGVTYESTAVYTANITSYLYTMLGRSTDTSLNRLMVHLLDYIAAAQQFAKYSTESLANANLTDAMKALRLPENTNYNNTFSETVNEGVSGATYLARSLYCDDSISFKYNFTFDTSKYSADDIKVVVKYKDDGDIMAEYTGDQIVYDTARSRYYVVVGLIAQNLSKDFEINVYTLDGTLISDKTLVNSIESMAAAYSAYPQYTDFLAAMMQYGRAAAAYANR